MSGREVPYEQSPTLEDFSWSQIPQLLGKDKE